MNSLSKMSKWLRPRNRRSRSARRKSSQRRSALERLDPRQMLSVSAMVTDSDVLFETVDQNMWASGSAAKIEAGFSETLLDVDFKSLSIGGYNKMWNPWGSNPETGLEVKASGGFELGFSGNFDVTGGEVDVDYQTDITVSALALDGSAFTSVEAGERFILRASESPDADAIAMETEFANIGAALNLDYALDVDASVKGKILDQTVTNTGFNTSIDNSIELLGADLDPGTGVGELRLLGGNDNWPIGATWDLEDALKFSDPTKIVSCEFYVPTLNTGDPNDSFDDSTWDAAKNEIVNAQLPVDRSQGQTRIDFFKLGIGIDDIFAKMSGTESKYSIGNSKVKLDAQLIDANLDAYLGIAQEMTFDPTIMVDLNFMDANNNPLATSVETTPGSGVFESVTTKRIGLDQDIEILHSGGTLNVDTDYVLTGTFRNDTDVYLSPAFDLSIFDFELKGSLVKTAQNLGLLKDDLGYNLYSNTFPLGDPLPLVGLFDQTFDLGGFSEVDGSDLSLVAAPSTTFNVVPSPEDSVIQEGQDLVVSGTIFDPVDGTADGSEVYELTIDWQDGSTETLTLGGGTSQPSHVTYDSANRLFSVSHRYGDEVGEQPTFTATQITPTSTDTSTASLPVQISNVAPTVSGDSLFLENSGAATLKGTFTDAGVQDKHKVTVDWGRGSSSVFNNVPKVGNLTVGQEISTTKGKTATLEVTAVDASAGTVSFEVTGKTYNGDPKRSLRLTVADKDGGEGKASTQVPWGLDLNIPSYTSAVNENDNARVEIRFEDNTTSVKQKYRLEVDWDDPNNPAVSTFDFNVDFLNFALGAGDTYQSDTDDAVLVVESVDFDVDWGFPTEFVFKPTFSIERPYADDGDVSNVVVNLYERDGVRGGTVILPVTVHNVAPTVTLDPTEEVGAGGVAFLSGTIADVGRLDAFTMDVDWGDGSAIETVSFDPSSTGSQDFVVPHTYTQDLDGGSHAVSVTVLDDDGASNTATESFVVDFDKAPVAFDDYVSTDADQILVINVLADNDLDGDPTGDPHPNDDVDSTDGDPEGNLDLSRLVIVGGSINPDTAEGLLTNNGDGTVTFDPTTAFASLYEGETATVEFDYQIEDTEGQTGTATVQIVVNGVKPLLDTSDLVAHWAFDEVVDGKVVDSAPQGATADDGTLSGGATVVNDATRGAVLRLDGVDDQIDVANSSDLNMSVVTERTISLWFKADEVDSRQVLFEEGGVNRGLSIYIDAGQLYVGAWASYDGWDGTFLSTTVTAGAWHNVTMTLDGTDTVQSDALKGYLDGELFGSGDGMKLGAHSNATGIGSKAGATVFHDGVGSGGDFRFAGLMDDLRIHDRVFAEDEVEDLWMWY